MISDEMVLSQLTAVLSVIDSLYRKYGVDLCDADTVLAQGARTIEQAALQSQQPEDHRRAHLDQLSANIKPSEVNAAPADPLGDAQDASDWWAKDAQPQGEAGELSLADAFDMGRAWEMRMKRPKVHEDSRAVARELGGDEFEPIREQLNEAEKAIGMNGFTTSEQGRVQAVAIFHEAFSKLRAAPSGEPVWQPIETAPKDGALVDLRQGPIVNLGCVWEDTRKGGRWIIEKGDYFPTIEPRQWRYAGASDADATD